MFTTAAVGALVFKIVQPDADVGEAPHTIATAAAAPVAAPTKERKGGRESAAASPAAAVATTPSAAQPAEPPYTIVYVAPELPPVDVDWIAAAQRRKMLDGSATIMKVAARDAATGAPIVLQLYPLRTTDHAVRKGKAPGGGSKNKWSSRAATPWPNLFWLMGREVQVRVGRLEHLGLIKTFRAKLQNNPELKDQFDADHRRYAELRWSLLVPEDREYALECGYDDALKHCGIGGVKYTLQVKCLHVHYAHYLATGQNLVGEWVQGALDANVDLQTKGKKNKDGVEVCAPATAQNKPDLKFSGMNKFKGAAVAEDGVTAGAPDVVADVVADVVDAQIRMVEQSYSGLQSDLMELRKRMNAVKERLGCIP